jgi:hypothetical protein
MSENSGDKPAEDVPDQMQLQGQVETQFNYQSARSEEREQSGHKTSKAWWKLNLGFLSAGITTGTHGPFQYKLTTRQAINIGLKIAIALFLSFTAVGLVTWWIGHAPSAGNNSGLPNFDDSIDGAAWIALLSS